LQELDSAKKVVKNIERELEDWKMNFPKISSPMVKVLWAGWESDTFTLQRAGWQISAEQDISSMRFRLAIKHPNFRIYGLGDLMDYGEYAEFKDNVYRQYPPVHIKYMASRMDIHVYDNLSNMNPIDCEPQFNIKETQVKSIEDFMIFRPINKANEIIVPDFQVRELLDLILKKQDPKQAEIRENKRKEWRKFTRQVNDAETISVEQNLDNRNDIVAQLICIR